MVELSAFFSRAAGNVHRAMKIAPEPKRMKPVLIFDGMKFLGLLAERVHDVGQSMPPIRVLQFSYRFQDIVPGHFRHR